MYYKLIACKVLAQQPCRHAGPAPRVCKEEPLLTKANPNVVYREFTLLVSDFHFGCYV